jgi:MFS family permease
MSAPAASALESPRSRVPQALRALRHRNFQYFFSGQLISLVGTWMQTIAEAWLVYRLTGSPWLLGMVRFMAQIPVFLLATLGGMVADRYNRHSIIVATQTISMVLALILALLTLTGRVHVWHVMVLATMLGVVNAFDLPARQAFLIEMVGKGDLMNAIALNSTIFNGARVVGPALAGILVAWIGEGWCFFANGISFIAVITGLLLMKLPRFQKVLNPPPFIENLMEGIRFVRNTTPIRALLLLIGLVSLVAVPYTVLMPIFADRILHGGARALGILMGASGVGAVLGALTLAAKKGLKGLSRWIPVASAGFGVCLILFSISRIFWLSVALLVPMGYGLMLQLSSTNTLIQAMVPDRLRGRTMAVYAMMFMGMAPIGSLLAGALASHIGAPLTVGIGGAVAIIGAAFFARHVPRIREQARELINTQGLVAQENAVGISPRAAS